MDKFPEFQKKPVKKLTYKEKVQKGLIRGGLRPVSAKQARKNAAYNKAISQDKEEDYICQFKGCCETKTLSRHHYKGRNFIQDYIYLCQKHHDEIHASSKWAKENYWLFPEYSGLPSNPDIKAPWL